MQGPHFSHSSSHNIHYQQDQQTVSGRPRPEDSARVRPKQCGPLPINRDFWSQGNGHLATPPTPSKTETELTHPTMLFAWKNILLAHAVCPILRENHPDKALELVRMILRSPGRGLGKGADSSKSLVLTILRWHLNQLYIKVPCWVFFE